MKDEFEQQDESILDELDGEEDEVPAADEDKDEDEDEEEGEGKTPEI